MDGGLSLVYMMDRGATWQELVLFIVVTSVVCLILKFIGSTKE